MKTTKKLLLITTTRYFLNVLYTPQNKKVIAPHINVKKGEKLKTLHNVFF